MTPLDCPRCGRPATGEHTCCPECGREGTKGAATPRKAPADRSPAPAEVTGWAIEKVPPGLQEWARQTLDEEAILASIREIETTGGLRLEDFIEEIERAATGRE